MKKSDPLKMIPLFNLVKGSERVRLAGEVKETRYRKGQFIFREGDPAEFFHIVKEGTVKCVKTSPDGKEVTLKVLMPGDLSVAKRRCSTAHLIPVVPNRWERSVCCASASKPILTC